MDSTIDYQKSQMFFDRPQASPRGPKQTVKDQKLTPKDLKSTSRGKKLFLEAIIKPYRNTSDSQRHSPPRKIYYQMSEIDY